MEDVVVTATRTRKDTSKIPANVTVIDAEDIKNSNARTVPDLLRSEEGKFKKAYRAYRQSVALGRKRGRIMLMIGLCAIHMKDPDLAKKALSEAAHFSRYRKEVTQILKSLSSYKNVLTDRRKGHGILTQGKGHG